MRVSPKALKEFKEIYKKEFGVELSDADALDKAIPLLHLMDAVYRPITEADLEKVRARQREISAKNTENK